MHTCYRDILSRIPEEPRWFDEHAVPRYCDFSPHETANIYANECILLSIECQYCRRPFKVAMSYHHLMGGKPLLANIESVHYGDPPNVDCCSGYSANSSPQQVLEAWSREAGKDWVRRPEFEIKIDAGY